MDGGGSTVLTFRHAGSHDAFAVVGRAACWGAGVGAASGGVLGTADWPVVGTFFAALAGGAVGGVVGVINGVTLAGSTTVTSSRWAARLVAALTSLACAVVPAYLMHASPRWDWIVPLALGTVLAAGIGPFAAFGVQPVVLGPRFRTRSVSDVAGRIVVGGLIAGAGIGGVAGLVLGLITYPPTAPFAVIEGAIFGSVSGVVLALLVAAAVVAPKLRVRR
jgi:hypothetical protein